jgi:pilus assembly protein CpaE
VILRLNIEAFIITEGTRRAIEAASIEGRMGRSRLSIHAGGLDAAIAAYSERPSPQLLFVEEVGDDQAMMAKLEALSEVVDPGIKVIVVGMLNDISLYRQLISQGIGEYMVVPISAEAVGATVANLFSDPDALPLGRSIAFFGARGGVGSSTLAHNIAWQLGVLAKDKSILLDLDLNFGTSSLDYNIDPKQTALGAVEQPERLDPTLLERFMPTHGEHVKVLSSTGELKTIPTPTPETMEKLTLMARQMASFVVLDIPHIWNEWTSFLLETVDEVVLVAQPDLLNLRDAKNLFAHLVSKRGIMPTRFVLNKIDAYKKTQLSTKDFQETLNAEPFLEIPFDPNLFGDAANNGQTVLESAKAHKISESLRQLAFKVSNLPETARGKGKGKGKEGGILGLDLVGWLKKGSSESKKG